MIKKIRIWYDKICPNSPTENFQELKDLKIWCDHKNYKTLYDLSVWLATGRWIGWKFVEMLQLVCGLQEENRNYKKLKVEQNLE